MGTDDRAENEGNIKDYEQARNKSLHEELFMADRISISTRKEAMLLAFLKSLRTVSTAKSHFMLNAGNYKYLQVSGKYIRKLKEYLPRTQRNSIVTQSTCLVNMQSQVAKPRVCHIIHV